MQHLFIWTRWSLRSIPAQGILWYSIIPPYYGDMGDTALCALGAPHSLLGLSLIQKSLWALWAPQGVGPKVWHQQLATVTCWFQQQDCTSALCWLNPMHTAVLFWLKAWQRLEALSLLTFSAKLEYAQWSIFQVSKMHLNGCIFQESVSYAF